MKTVLLTLSVLFVTNLLSAQSDSARFYFNKGMDEKNARRYMMASGYFDKAIKFDANYADAYIENGRANLEMRRIDPAQGYFTRAFELQPSNTAVIKELTSLYFNNRQFQKAIDLAAKCNCPEADKIIGLSAYHLEDYNRAVTVLMKYVAKNGTDAEALYTIGRSLLEQEDFRNAIPWYIKAINADNTRNGWMYELGLTFYNANDFTNAVKYFKMAGDAGYIKSNDYLENLGFAYLSIGDAENGLKTLQSVLQRTPNSKELLTQIASALYFAKKYDDALTFYQKLMELDPKNASALYMAGMSFQKKGDKERGKAMCDKAIQLDPSLEKNRTKISGENFGL